MEILYISQFCFAFRGKTFFYPTYDEAEKMARFMGVKTRDIKECEMA